VEGDGAEPTWIAAPNRIDWPPVSDCYRITQEEGIQTTLCQDVGSGTVFELSPGE